MCSRETFMLWVGCGSVDFDTTRSDEKPTTNEDIVWHCFATAEVFFWKRLFRKVDTAPAVAKLYSDLGEILRAEQEINCVEELTTVRLT